jgi:hypothetical protein
MVELLVTPYSSAILYEIRLWVLISHLNRNSKALKKALNISGDLIRQTLIQDGATHHIQWVE